MGYGSSTFCCWKPLHYFSTSSHFCAKTSSKNCKILKPKNLRYSQTFLRLRSSTENLLVSVELYLVNKGYFQLQFLFIFCRHFDQQDSIQPGLNAEQFPITIFVRYPFRSNKCTIVLSLKVLSNYEKNLKSIGIRPDTGVDA